MDRKDFLRKMGLGVIIATIIPKDLIIEDKKPVNNNHNNLGEIQDIGGGWYRREFYTTQYRDGTIKYYKGGDIKTI